MSKMKNLSKFATSNIKDSILNLCLKGKIIEKKQGTYGVVFIVEQEALPRYVAYKTIQPTILEQIDENKLKNFIREMKQWFKVKGHPLILTPYFITFVRKLPLVCMPFCEMDLYTYLERHGKLSAIESLIIAAQILKGLMFSKSNGIEAHQDLKPKNILLEDLSKKFVDFPPKDMPFFRYRVRIADFGNANAWRELGKPHGSKPYMAPEQFMGKGDFSKADIFAVGVILYELLTGKHPIGERTGDLWPEPKKGLPRKYKHEGLWKKWATRVNKLIKIDDDETSKEIESLIREMLLPDPNKRISLDETFQRIIDILSKLNEAVTNYLKILLEYYDDLAKYFHENLGRLVNLMELSKVPTLLDPILDEMLKEITEIEGKISTPNEAVYFIELCYRSSCLLLKRNTMKDREKAEELAKKIILETIKWKEKIKVVHKYPPLKFKEVEIIKIPPFRDFEVHAELINYGKKLLDEILGPEESEKFFEKLEDRYIKALYFFNIAADFRMKGDIKKAIEVLDNCIGLQPNEPTLYFMKALWVSQHLIIQKATKKLTDDEKRLLTSLIRENAEKAMQMAPDWEEPKKILSELSENNSGP
jgi:serine/threonine protein kinase